MQEKKMFSGKQIWSSNQRKEGSVEDRGEVLREAEFYN